MAEPAFGICYDPGKELGLFRCFEVLVLEFSYPPAHVATLVGQGKTVFGYVSLGKVDEGRSWFPRLHDVGALESFEAGTDPRVWKINVAHPEWERLLMGQVLPELRSNGFVGAFLDDLDDIFVRKEHPDAVQLIRRIHETFPDLLLMGNRGYSFSPISARVCSTACWKAVSRRISKSGRRETWSFVWRICARPSGSIPGSWAAPPIITRCARSPLRPSLAV